MNELLVGQAYPTEVGRGGGGLGWGKPQGPQQKTFPLQPPELYLRTGGADSYGQA